MLPKTVVPAPVLGALEHINWNYGRGDIVGFASFHQTDGVAVMRLQYGTESAAFRVVDGTVYFRGHQRKVK